MSKLKQIIFVLVGLIAVGIIASVVVAFDPGQTGNSSLTQLALQPSDLPDSDWRVAEATNVDDVSQPLSRANIANLAPTQSQALVNYRSAYKTEALVVVFDELFAAYVGNYLYRYGSSDEADKAAKVLQGAFAREGVSVAVPTNTEQQGVTGQAFSLRGTAGDAIYFFVGTQNDVLVLLMVNGELSPETEAGFISLIEVLRSK